jgi:hypothetical protein
LWWAARAFEAIRERVVVARRIIDAEIDVQSFVGVCLMTQKDVLTFHWCGLGIRNVQDVGFKPVLVDFYTQVGRGDVASRVEG